MKPLISLLQGIRGFIFGAKWPPQIIFGRLLNHFSISNINFYDCVHSAARSVSVSLTAKLAATNAISDIKMDMTTECIPIGFG